MRETTPMVRLGGTAVLFVIALGLFVVASVTHVAWPLFVAWAPLIAVPWLLTRPEAGRHGADAPESAEADASEARATEEDSADTSSGTAVQPTAAETDGARTGDPAGTSGDDSN